MLFTIGHSYSLLIILVYIIMLIISFSSADAAINEHFHRFWPQSTHKLIIMGQLLSSEEEFSQVKDEIGSLLYHGMLEGEALPNLAVVHPLRLASHDEMVDSGARLQEQLRQVNDMSGDDDAEEQDIKRIYTDKKKIIPFLAMCSSQKDK